jgi:hypothetical protein
MKLFKFATLGRIASASTLIEGMNGWSEQGTRFRAQTDVHRLIRVQKRALGIASSPGFRNEDMVRFNVTFVSGRR